MAAIKTFAIEQKNISGGTILWHTRGPYKEVKELVDNHFMKQFPKDTFKIKVVRNLFGVGRLMPPDCYYDGDYEEDKNVD